MSKATKTKKKTKSKPPTEQASLLQEMFPDEDFSEPEPEPEVEPRDWHEMGYEDPITPDMAPLAKLRHQYRRQHKTKTRRDLIPNLKRNLVHGWLLPYLIRGDAVTWKRWLYWEDVINGYGKLPEEPIPKIHFLGAVHSETMKMLETCLDSIPDHGSWRSWGGWEYFRFFMDWLLYAFGHPGHKELPKESKECQGANMRLYQLFNLDMMLLFPYDYFGNLLAENSYGRRQGFYPTPHTVCEMMVLMTMGDPSNKADVDPRLLLMGDPCTGTGRFPLHASNYTLRMQVQDVDPTLIQATLCNGYMYAPWLVKPIPWFDRGSNILVGDTLRPEPGKPVTGEALEALNELTKVLKSASDALVEAGQSGAYLDDTEFDAEGSQKFYPVIQRKRVSTPKPKTADSTIEGQHSLFDL